MNKRIEKALIVMGVSGSGKSTVGTLLAKRLKVPFWDADDFHPAQNVAKMSQGIALEDEDRWPWLERIQHHIARSLSEGQGSVWACSALKQRYRAVLQADNPEVLFVYLHGEFELIRDRMLQRKAHFMPDSLLKSQFEALEEPSREEAIWISIDQSLEDILAEIEYEIPR